MMYEEPSAPEPTPEATAAKRKKRQAGLYRRRRAMFVLGLVGGCAALAVIVLVAIAASRSSSQISPEELLAGSSRYPTAPVLATGEENPAFARFGNRNLLLPVAAADATILAYQPVSDTRAVALAPIGQRVNVNGFVRFFRDLFTGEPDVRYYQLSGESGAQTSSALIGAQPGTPVTSPISGVVTSVTTYYLFGKFEDVRIDIRPEAKGGTTITLMFISDPAVTIGERVEAGKTLLGTVRRCPEEVGEILAVYTHDSGSHIHLLVYEEPIR